MNLGQLSSDLSSFNALNSFRYHSIYSYNYSGIFFDASRITNGKSDQWVICFRNSLVIRKHGQRSTQKVMASCSSFALYLLKYFMYSSLALLCWGRSLRIQNACGIAKQGEAEQG